MCELINESKFGFVQSFLFEESQNVEKGKMLKDGVV